MTTTSEQLSDLLVKWDTFRARLQPTGDVYAIVTSMMIEVGTLISTEEAVQCAPSMKEKIMGFRPWKKAAS